MNTEFNAWWNADNLANNNPYEEDSAAYWAWEGWQAAVLAEREACAKVCDDIESKRWETMANGGALVGWTPKDCAAAIRGIK